MKKFYEWRDKSGRTYYKTIYWLDGKRLQRTLRSREEAEDWYNGMVHVYGTCISGGNGTEYYQPRSDWWRVQFTPLHCHLHMIVVPGMRCRHYWECLRHVDCLNMAAKLDWPGWAEIEVANNFYKRR